MRRVLVAFPIAFAVLLAGACAPSTSSGGTGSSGATATTAKATTTTAKPTATTAPAADWRAAMLTRINSERAKVGAAALRLCGELNNAAQGHSVDMATHNMTSHSGSNGSTFVQRIEAAGYTNWNALAENVASGYFDVNTVMTGWMNSPDHRANLLSTSYVHVGLGASTAPSGVPYWTQDFGKGDPC